MRKLIAVLLSLVLCTVALADGINVPAPAYVQGAWTPTLTTSGTVGTPAYTTQVGSYEKIGRQVTVRFTLVLSGWTGSPTGSPLIVLPLTPTATTNDNGSCIFPSYTVTGLPALNYGLGGLVVPNSTSAFILANGNASTPAITMAQLGTTPSLIGTCFYRTD